jgi:hypothetical protein
MYRPTFGPFDSVVRDPGIAAMLIAGMLFGVLTTESASASPASSARSVKFNVGLQPKALGKSTTISIGFQVATSNGELPSPLTSFNFSLPEGMGLADTTLGIDSCSAETLVHDGAGSCPPDAAMGLGSAVAEAAVGSEIVRESGRVLAFMTQARNNNTTLLYYFDGRAPVIVPAVFLGELLSSGNSPISEFALGLPVIPVLPETPDAAIVSMHMTVGPRDLTYYKRVGNRMVAYKPSGMSVPTVCPRRGFLFSARFGFADGTHFSTTKRVACP